MEVEEEAMAEDLTLRMQQYERSVVVVLVVNWDVLVRLRLGLLELG